VKHPQKLFIKIIPGGCPRIRKQDAGGVSPPVAIFSLKMINITFPGRLLERNPIENTGTVKNGFTQRRREHGGKSRNRTLSVSASPREKSCRAKFLFSPTKISKYRIKQNLEGRFFVS
jgi:hypothetical protein